MNNFKEYIDIKGARVHNLKDIDVKIPRNQLVVITGLSGSGKSSLAFDTIYAEGQRRYIETFSAYARQFLGSLERPDVDKIDGLSPVIAIEQKTTSKSPRSTVGTITEIYDFMRLLFARGSNAYSYETNEKMISYDDDQIKVLIAESFKNKKISILAPTVRSRKGHYRELFEQIAKQGFVKVRVDGKIIDITPGMRVDRYKMHDIEIVIDRLIVNEKTLNSKRLEESIVTGMSYGDNMIMVIDEELKKPRYFSRNLMCPSTGLSYQNPEPNNFSFNSPKGACPDCNGIGSMYKINEKKIIPNPKLSIKNGGLAPQGSQKNSWIFKQIELIAKRYKFSLSDPISKIPKDALELILYGGKDKFSVESKSLGISRNYDINFDGIANFIEYQYKNSKREYQKAIRENKNRYYKTKLENCKGDSKKTWRIINECLNRPDKKGNKTSRKEHLIIDGKLIESNEDIATEFNKFYKNIAFDIAKKIEHSNKPQYYYLQQSKEPIDVSITKRGIHRLTEKRNDMKPSDQMSTCNWCLSILVASNRYKVL